MAKHTREHMHHRMPRGDAMAANAGMSDYHSKNLRGASSDNKYAIPGMDINPIGEYAETAKCVHARPRMGALDQMTNGSMDYLSHEDKKFEHNVSRIRKHKLNHIEME